MTDFLIVGTIHEEKANPKVSSATLLGIASVYRPDAVMCECAIDEFELNRVKLFDFGSTSLEACFFAKYRSMYGKEPIPIDMAGKSSKFYNKDYWKKESTVWQSLEELAKTNPKLAEHKRTWDFIEEVGNSCSYNVINSTFFDNMVLHAYYLMDEVIPEIIQKKLPDYFDFWTESVDLRHRRDSEIFSNMMSKSSGFRRILVLVGAGHSPVIRRQIVPLITKSEFTVSQLWEIE